jgi:hypothetical protein
MSFESSWNIHIYMGAYRVYFDFSFFSGTAYSKTLLIHAALDWIA